MLSPLQELILRLVAPLPEAQGFALAGGGAIITRGIVDRTTNDLDLFGAAPPDVQRLAFALSAALRSEGMVVTPIIEQPAFVRLAVERGTDSTTIDLGTDARVHPAEETDRGQVLSLEELAADKLLAVFGRAQARDFIDAMALAGEVGGLDEMCRLAAEKDGGFSKAVLIEMIGSFDRLPPAEFELSEHGYAELREAVQGWLAHLRN